MGAHGARRSMRYTQWRPLWSAVTKSASPSADQTSSEGEVSHLPQTSRREPVRRSKILMRLVSASSVRSSSFFEPSEGDAKGAQLLRLQPADAMER